MISLIFGRNKITDNCYFELSTYDVILPEAGILLG